MNVISLIVYHTELSYNIKRRFSTSQRFVAVCNAIYYYLLYQNVSDDRLGHPFYGFTSDVIQQLAQTGFGRQFSANFVPATYKTNWKANELAVVIKYAVSNR